MKLTPFFFTFIFTLGFFVVGSGSAIAEPMEEYPGIADPFQDPFKDNSVQIDESPLEKEAQGTPTGTDRNFLLGLDAGMGIFTGGLGASTPPAAYFGARICYFFNPQISLELAGHWGSFLDQIQGTQIVDVETTLIPITLGLRYYFGNQSNSTVRLTNPYIGAGGGTYLRSQRPLNNAPLDPGDNSQFGAWATIGLEFPVVERKLFLGLDLRYHLIFFVDEADTLDGLVQEGDRAGDFFAPTATFSYSF